MSLSMVLVAAITISIMPKESAYASGVIQQSSPGYRITSLPYNVNHSMQNDERHTFVTISFLEGRNEPIRFVTYGMNITKVGSDEPILRYDAFHTENGTLILDVKHTDGEETKVFATREDFLNAWKADSETSTVRMEMPLQPDSKYLMHIEIIGIDHVRGLLDRAQVPKIDLYFNTEENETGEAAVVPGELVVVPEFPYHILLVVSVLIGSIIAISRTGLVRRFYGTGK